VEEKEKEEEEKEEPARHPVAMWLRWRWRSALPWTLQRAASLCCCPSEAWDLVLLPAEKESKMEEEEEEHEEEERR